MSIQALIQGENCQFPFRKQAYNNEASKIDVLLAGVKIMGMDVYGKAPTGKAGEYFRANIWSWRPIHALCETVLGRELPSWGFNDGDGLQSQAECDELANKLTAYLKAFPGERIALESDMRINPHTGEFLRRGTKEGVTAYSTTRGHVREFIRFLRACGGFEIN